MSDSVTEAVMAASCLVLIAVMVFLHRRKKLPGLFTLALSLFLTSDAVRLLASSMDAPRGSGSLVAWLNIVIMAGAWTALAWQLRTWHADRASD